MLTSSKTFNNGILWLMNRQGEEDFTLNCLTTLKLSK